MRYKSTEEWDHVLDTECQLAAPAILADGSVWTGFSVVLAECDSDGRSGGYRTVGKGCMQRIDDSYDL